MLKKVQILIFRSLFGSIFGAVWGVWGVAEFKLRLQADFNCDLTRPAPQAGVRRIKNRYEINAKSMLEKGMRKGLQTRSVTAAPLGHQPMKANRSEARNRQILATLAIKRGPKTCQNHQNIVDAE